MPPERRARNEAAARKMIDEMALDELREARELTQQQLARLFRVNQAAVLKMERRADMYLSTLHGIIKAMGKKQRCWLADRRRTEKPQRGDPVSRPFDRYYRAAEWIFRSHCQYAAALPADTGSHRNTILAFARRTSAGHGEFCAALFC